MPLVSYSYILRKWFIQTIKKICDRSEFYCKILRESLDLFLPFCKNIFIILLSDGGDISRIGPKFVKHWHYGGSKKKKNFYQHRIVIKRYTWHDKCLTIVLVIINRKGHNIVTIISILTWKYNDNEGGTGTYCAVSLDHLKYHKTRNIFILTLMG